MSGFLKKIRAALFKKRGVRIASDNSATNATDITINLPQHEELWAEAINEVFKEQGIEATVEVVPTQSADAPSKKEASVRPQPNLNRDTGSLTPTELELLSQLPRRSADSFDKLEPNLKIAAELLHADYEDLICSVEQRREVGVVLARAALRYDTLAESAERLLHATGGVLPCPEQLAARVFEKFGNVASIYVQTKLAEASCRMTLNQLKSSAVDKGVEILIGDEDCPTCRKGKHRFLWADIESCPKLPRHWGCTCTYLAWFDP